MGNVIREIEEHLRAVCVSQKMLDKNGRALVGVSGGSDSVALLLALHQLSKAPDVNWKLHVAHVSHGDGPWDRETLEWVEALASRLGLPFHHSGILAGAKSEPVPGESMQMRERRLRHGGLFAMADGIGAGYIVLAHTMDDQAETVLMRSSAGHWLSGLSGIRAESRYVRQDSALFLVHPLLGLRRQTLRDYLTLRGETWREDPHNELSEVRRNRIRREVMPVLGDVMGQDPVPCLALMAKQAGEFSDMVLLMVGEILTEVTHRAVVEREDGPLVGGVASLPADLMKQLPEIIGRELIRLSLQRLGAGPREASYSRADALLDAIQKGKSRKQWDVGAGITAVVKNGVLGITSSMKAFGGPGGENDE